MIFKVLINFFLQNMFVAGFRMKLMRDSNSAAQEKTATLNHEIMR
jgi:hypothetical protein